MSKRKLLSDKELREKYQRENPKDSEKIDKLFNQLEDTVEVKKELDDKENAEAVKTYKDLIVQKIEEVKLNGVIFKFRKHATALEFEERQLIKKPKEKLAHLHKFLVEPIMSLEDFLLMPPEIPKYIEQKIMEDFMRGLVQIALQNSPDQESEN